ncbi:MAG: hypothetical protein KY438_03315 [Actinobacteria bacterium]|nr:hypothetical protein [Actinomycetota bacterium]
MRSVEPGAVLPGALTAAVIALPVGLAGQIVVDGTRTNSSVLALVFLVPILVAFAAGGFVTARRAGAAPLTNGALAAVAAFALIQGVGVVRRLVSGEDISPASLAFAAFLAYSCGLVGALAAQRQATGRASGTSAAGQTTDPES